jgi:hypothetical protein
MHLRHDALRLVFLCEKIEIACRDGTLSPNEAIFVRHCATQLLKSIPEPVLATALNGTDFTETATTTTVVLLADEAP